MNPQKNGYRKFTSISDSEIDEIGIVVIQSLSNKESQTGLELCNEVLHYKEFQQHDTKYFLWKYTPYSKSEFIEAIDNILIRQNSKMIFTLHIESHGNDDGVVLASGEVVPWHDFMNLIRPINIQMQHMLILVLAMCLGGAIISTIDSKKRAPYRACICSYKEVTVDQIRRGFSAFYSEYTSPLDIVKGIAALQVELSNPNNQYGPFRIFSARDVFIQTFNLDRDLMTKEHLINMAYVATRSKGISCTKEDIEKDIRETFKKEIEENLPYYDFKDI